VEIKIMDKITNNILNNIAKNNVKDSKNINSNITSNLNVIKSEENSNIVDLKDTKKLVSDLASSAPIDTDKVAKIKAAISSGNYPLDLDKISDALMQAYREMKS
jgi:negative regulator of flagellin synthesis FlgM|tara:strand:- start:147 stop:458 length:312 start_codon:yes stop_codon:yes gene_type:complete